MVTIADLKKEAESQVLYEKDKNTKIATITFNRPEVLNALTRHKSLAEPMHAFLHNVVRGFVGTTHRVAVISLPRSHQRGDYCTTRCRHDVAVGA